MTQFAVRVAEPKKNGAGVQLTEVKGIEIVTVTSEPDVAELGGLGLTVTVAPLIEPAVR